MKEPIKITDNLEFDVIYSDGTRRHVKEGFLFEACEDNTTAFHIGTERPEVFMAFFRATIEMMNDLRRMKEENHE